MLAKERDVEMAGKALDVITTELAMARVKRDWLVTELAVTRAEAAGECIRAAKVQGAAVGGGLGMDWAVVKKANRRSVREMAGQYLREKFKERMEGS